MPTISLRSYGKFQAKVRVKGFPAESKQFPTREEAEQWGARREEALLAVREGRSAKWIDMSTADSFLHINQGKGKPRAILLRAYQTQSINAAQRSLATKPDCAPLVCLPTGSGKTIVISGLIERLMSSQPDARFMVVTHTQELVSQDHDRFLDYACLESEKIGIASAGLGTVDLEKQVTFGTIQTLASRGFSQWVDYIFIDEAHMLPPSEETSYRRFIKAARGINPAARVVGFTATPYRADSGLLTEGDGALFSEICYEAYIPDLIRDKYLCPLVSTGSPHHVDDSRLMIRGADFDEASSESEMASLTPQIIADLLRTASDRKSWLVFCTSIKHANDVASELRRAGIDSAAVSSAISKSERAELLDRFQNGKLRALVNVNVLTTGFDAPHTDLIVSLRPTISTSLWVQICGRGMRTHKSKKNCLVLDYANNIARHGPIDTISVSASTEDAPAPARWDSRLASACPNCGTLCGPRTIVCPNCGELVRSVASVTLSSVASSLPVMSGPDKYKHERLSDLRDIIGFYLIDDIEQNLSEESCSPQAVVALQKYLRAYQSIVLNTGKAFTPQVCYSVEEIAADLGLVPADLKKQIESNTFPRPRILSEDGIACYSAMQVAVIAAGDAQSLLPVDHTYLWYQHLIRKLEIEISAANK